MSECTFQPTVNAGSCSAKKTQASGNSSRLPLHERVGEVLRSRNEKLSDARIKVVRDSSGLSCLVHSNKVNINININISTPFSIAIT